MSGGLVPKLELAKQDKRALNALILEYLPFIKKNVQAAFYDKEGRQDAMTDAMLAFVQAVQTYNAENGSFAAYSAAVMRNRVINFAKKEWTCLRTRLVLKQVSQNAPRFAVFLTEVV